jgi:hypothetical protein
MRSNVLTRYNNWSTGQLPNRGPATVQAVHGLVRQEIVSCCSRFSCPNPNFRVVMSISKCVVRLRDSHDIEHSVIVYAESLYEAVVRGLNQLGNVGWESDSNETIKQVEVEIHQEPTKHIVDVPRLLKWVEQNSMYPGQETRKEKLRKLLGKR